MIWGSIQTLDMIWHEQHLCLQYKAYEILVQVNPARTETEFRMAELGHCQYHGCWCLGSLNCQGISIATNANPRQQPCYQLWRTCPYIILMAWCNTATSPLLTHRRHCNLALNHRYHPRGRTSANYTIFEFDLLNVKMGLKIKPYLYFLKTTEHIMG